MAELVADYILKRLREWGIHRIYGYPGDGINGFLGALDRANDKTEFIQARHEEMAAFMACGHAKFTGEVGICMATSGPGAIHLLNGLYDAKLDHKQVVAIVGQQKRMSLGAEVGSAWEQALAADRPCVLEVKTDPEIPPLPQHITRERAEKMAKAMVKGDPERTGVMQKSLLGKLAEFKESLPGRK